VALALLACAITTASVHVLHIGARLSEQHPAMLNAASGIQLSVTTAHLWVEEILSGDRNESMEDVWAHLEAADQATRAMIQGSDEPRGRVFPLQDPALREKLREVRTILTNFRAATAQRWQGQAGTTSAGTEIDQEYDRIFESLIRATSDVGLGIHGLIDEELQRFRIVQILIVIGSFLLVTLAGTMIVRYDRERERTADLRERLTHVSRVVTLGEMATGLAHEINQPLTAIAAQAQASVNRLRGGGATDPAVLESLGLISDEALRAGEVIRRLRSLVQRSESERQIIDLNEVIREVRRLVQSDIKASGFRFLTRLSTAPVTVLADPIQMQQVLLNLIRNALDAMREGHGNIHDAIIVESRIDEGTAEIRVIDGGPGFPEDTRAKFFEPFHTTKTGGLGLGLSISRTILETHGGTLRHADEPGPGAALSFTLPVHRE
jgi:signal transduction histidine kinase